MNSKRNIAIMAIIFICFNLMSQSVISSAGNVFIGTTGSASCTVGQIAYSTNIGTNASEVQGVNQPVHQQIPTGLLTNNLEFELYPTPTCETITISTNSLNQENYNYSVINLQGQSVIVGDVNSLQTQIDLSSLSPSLYLIKITAQKRTLKTYKITKR